MRSEIIKAVDARMVSVSVQDVDRMPIWRAYSMHSTGTLEPERVEMRWENGYLVRLAVYGKRVKNSGEVGNGDTSTQFVQHGNTLENNPRPEWLDKLARENAPLGVMNS